MQETTFTREILEQPSALGTVARHYQSEHGRRLLMDASLAFNSARQVVLSGMGTSFHSPDLVLRELQCVGPAVMTVEAGELLHFGLDSLSKETLLIAISQSGESAETRHLVKRLRGRTRIVSIVNHESSFMGCNSDLVLPMHAGEETSISNKTYTNTLAVLKLLAAATRQADLEVACSALAETAEIQEQSLEQTWQQARSAAKFLGHPSNLHVVARGTDLVTARQLALITKEGAGLFTEALSAGSFRHGPIEMAGSGHHVLFVISRDSRPELTQKLATEMAAIGSRVIILTDLPEDQDRASILELKLTAGSFGAGYFPLFCAPFIEYLVHEVAAGKGKEAGIFRHAEKITAKE